MRLDNDIKLDYKDVLIRPKRSTLSSRKQVELLRSFSFRNYTPADMTMEVLRPESNPHYEGIPIMAANMDGVGTFEMADTLAAQGIFTCLVKTYSVEQLLNFFDTDDYLRTNYVAMSIGITDDDWCKFQNVMGLVDGNLKYVCVDVANGYSERFTQFIRKLRKEYPNIVIIAGNVVTGEMTEELILSGADIVKVGIGPGSVCTTRIQTGVGFPQLSAVIECADAAHGLGGHIIADGGCSSPGDVVKAFGAGADFVMLGGMFAGCNEGGGDIENGKVKFYGSSTTVAQEENGGVQDHRTSEGRIVEIPHKGPVANVVTDILGGLRSGCTYVGANKLKNLSKCTTFVQVNGGKTHNQIFEKVTVGE